VFVLFFFALRLNPRALVLTGSGTLLCGLYAVPFAHWQRSRGGRTRLRLKAIPFLKAPFVGASVGTAVVWVPLWAANARIPLSQSLALTGALSFYCCTNALLFDIPDVEEDARAKIPTIPLSFGLVETRATCRALLCAGFFCSVLFCSQVTLGWHSVGLFALGTTLLIFTQHLHFRTARHLVALSVDGALLLPLVFQYSLRLYSTLQ
jgi:4-hydroxybenzoate polyprenyltransferase